MSIHELAAAVRDAASSASEIVFVPYRDAYLEGFEDMDRRVPDVAKLQSLIGFRPRIPLSTIIGDVLMDQEAWLTLEDTQPGVAETLRANTPVAAAAPARASA